MKDQEVKESNRLIADFMGEEKCPYGVGTNQVHTDDLKYHSSYDWLMPVVEKIARYEYEDDIDTAYLRTFGKIDQGGDFMVRFNRQILFTMPTLIEATWLAVVDFIKWFNSQNKTPIG